MALKRTLTAGWLLSDGILNAFPIGEPRDVLTAATEALFAPDPLVGMNLTRAEWVYNRRWRYASRFDTPLEDDERVWLLFQRLCGAGEVLVNGRLAGCFTGGETLIEVTELLAPAENELTVRFEAPGLRLPAENPMPLLGIAGPVCLLTGNGLSLDHLRSRARGKALAVDQELTVCTAGKYMFMYTASQDGALWRRWAFEEALEVGRAQICHTLNWVDKPENENMASTDGPLDVRVDITRTGVGCAQARFEAGRPEWPSPRRTLMVRGGVLTEDMARAMAEIGADSVCLADETPGRVDADCLFGLRKRNGGEVFSCLACVRDLSREAAGEDCWPPRAPIWRLRGGQAPDATALGALYGGRARADGALAARLTRYEQAEAALRYALACRQSGDRAILPWNAEWESLASDALTERGGRRRMACDALRRAWAKDVAWVDWPAHEAAEPGAPLEVSLWAATDRPGGLEATLVAEAFSLDGRRLALKKEAVRVRTATRVGALSLTAPGDGAVILRCALLDGAGKALCRVDRTLPVKHGVAPLEAIYLSAAVISRGAKGVVNTGSVAALAVGECLLPGEAAEWADEWVNEGTTATE